MSSNEFVDIPEMTEFPYFQKAGSHHFNKDRVTAVKDVKAGTYIRVFFQPIYQNGNMLAVSVERFRGRPFRYRGKDSYLNTLLKIRTQNDACSYRQSTFLGDNGVYYGVPERHFRPGGARLYRYSSRLMKEIEAIKALGDYAAWCWWCDVEPCHETYLDFNMHVSEERYTDRMMSVDDLYFDDVRDEWEDEEVEEDNEEDM